MDQSILSLDILEDEKIILNTLRNFVDWFAPNREAKENMKEFLLIIGNELEDYRKLKGQNQWH